MVPPQQRSFRDAVPTHPNTCHKTEFLSEPALVSGSSTLVLYTWMLLLSNFMFSCTLH